MKKLATIIKQLLVPFLLYIAVTTNAQSVGIGPTTPNPSAQLDVNSTTKGFLLPRMTAAQRTAIATPAEGLMVYQTTAPVGFYYYKSGVWTSLSESTTTPGGTVYPSITICSQLWMDKNLDVTTYRNGDPIPYVPDPTAWAALTTGAWCYYNNDPSNNATYGKLYNWYAVNDPRGLAPTGWHVPSDAEWTTLETCLGGASIAGGKMKVTGTTTWTSPNSGATNSSSFSGLPGGFRYSSGVFTGLHSSGNWWSSTTSSDPDYAWFRSLGYFSSSLDASDDEKRVGFSVRCIKD